MISADHRRRITLFNEMAEVLLGSRFVARIFGEPIGVKISGESNGQVTAEVSGPDEESARPQLSRDRGLIVDLPHPTEGDTVGILDKRSDARFHLYRVGINQFLDSPPSRCR